MRNPSRLLGSLAVAILGLAACSTTTSIDDPSTVFFHIEAPLCSMALPVRFSIDGTVVGVDTFRVNVSNPHLTTMGFTTTGGVHVLSAFAFNGTWPDTTVTLSPGFALTDTLSFYCS